MWQGLKERLKIYYSYVLEFRCKSGTPHWYPQLPQYLFVKKDLTLHSYAFNQNSWDKKCQIILEKITPIKNVNVYFPWLSNSACGNIYNPPPQFERMFLTQRCSMQCFLKIK